MLPALKSGRRGRVRPGAWAGAAHDWQWAVDETAGWGGVGEWQFGHLTRRDLVKLGMLAAASVALPLADVLRAVTPALAEGEGESEEPTYQDVSTYAEEGCGITRIVTPYYSVCLENSLFPDGMAYNYVENVAAGDLSDEAAAAGVSVFGELDIRSVAQGQDSSVIAAVPCYRVCCSASDLGQEAPYAGDYAVARLSSDSSSVSGFGVYACVPVDGGDASSAQAKADALCAHLCADAKGTRLVRGGSSTRVETPAYAVDLPDALLAGGWYYTYDAGACEGGLPGTDGDVACTVRVVAAGQDAGSGAAEMAFGVACVRDGAQLAGGVAATQAVGELGGSWAGWQLVAYADAAEAAGQLGTYAACVNAR